MRISDWSSDVCSSDLAFSSLPGSLRLIDPEPVEMLLPDGRITQGEHGRHLHLNVRPEAPVRILLTGHMDTVFAVDHPFQLLAWLEEGMLNGPGISEIQDGLALMLAASTEIGSATGRRRRSQDVKNQEGAGRIKK